MDAKELIDIICPEHCRTSCSDIDLSNTWCMAEDIYLFYPHRCTRCALLSIIKGKELPENKEFECYLSIINKGE